MQRVSLDDARAKIVADIEAFLGRTRTILTADARTVEQGIRLLKQLRSHGYEELNQIQHEYAALRAIEWLIEHDGRLAGVSWLWNPRQTGGIDEPDIRAQMGATILVSAEVTTSPAPKGLIDGRMRDTLQKLSRMTGDRYYFVTTAEMAQRARSKVTGSGHNIRVVLLPSVDLQPG